MINIVSGVSMAVTALMLIVSYGIANYLRRKQKTSSADGWVMCWLIWDAMIHFFVEGPFVLISLTNTIEESDHFTALLWKEYAKADRRWGVSDPTIVALEMLTVFLDGPLCVMVVMGICKRTASRHLLQLTLCVCELYGGWMTFVPDMLVGSPSLSTNNRLYLWVYLVFYNGIWVIVPALLIYQSWRAIVTEFRTARALTSKEKQSHTGSVYNSRSKNKDT